MSRRWTSAIGLPRTPLSRPRRRTAPRSMYIIMTGWAEGDFFKKVSWRSHRLGLKQIIKECYGFVVADFVAGDEIYIFGFSRGAYAARALAGLIGASGIQREADADTFEVAWQHYRVNPAARLHPETANSADQKTIADYKALAASRRFTIPAL